MQTYVAIDGDDVGRRLEYLLLTNQVEALTVFSRTFQDTIDWLAERLVQLLNANLIFCGGDNTLAAFEMRASSMGELAILKDDFRERSSCTLSIICQYREVGHV